MTPNTLISRKIKILFVLRMIGYGGAERQVVELCQGLNKDLFDVTVILFFHEEGYMQELKKTGVRIEILATKQTYKHTAFLQLMNFIREEKFDIIQTFLPIANLLGGLAARLTSRSIVIGSLRNANPVSWRDKFCLMDLLALNWLSDQVVVNSQAGARCTIEKYGVPPGKVRVIRNGKNFAQYMSHHQSDECLRQELGIPPGCRVVTTIGRISKQKGYEYLIRAANILVHQKGVGVVFLLVGKAEETFPEIRALIKYFRLGDNIKLLGVREDIADILNISDVFVLPSLWEGLANVLLEAMIARVPVVATDIEANAEVIDHNHSGLLVPPCRPRELAEAILKMIDNPDLADRLASQAYQDVVQKFNLQRLVKEHESLYQTLCEQS